MWDTYEADVYDEDGNVIGSLPIRAESADEARAHIKSLLKGIIKGNKIFFRSRGGQQVSTDLSTTRKVSD